MSAQPDTSRALEQRDPAREAIATIRTAEFKQQIAIALPEGVTPDRFVRATVTALAQNPEIAAANRDSLFQSIIRAAQDGLMPDGREAALVVFRTKEGPKAQYLPMIGGLRKIAAEHGWTLRTAVVHEHDDFDYELGLDPRLIHRPARPGVERGGMIAAVAVATHRDGRREFEVMDRTEIEKVRATSRAKDYGPWVDWPERMWEKTVGRRLFAKLPLDPADVRVSRVLTDDPVAAVYGPERRHPPVRGEIVAGSSGPVSEAGAASSSSPGEAAGTPDDERQQVGGEGRAAASSPPAPGGEAQAALPVDEPPHPEIVAAAGAQVFPGGVHKDKTVAQVYAYDPHYFSSGAWKKLTGAPAEFKQAVEIYLAGQEQTS